MKIESRETGDVTILDCSGKITLGEGTMALRQAVRVQLAKGRRKIVLNLAEVRYIDSSGIGEMVGVYTSITNMGGGIKILNMVRGIKDLFETTKLATVFAYFDNEAEVIASFSPKPAAREDATSLPS